MKEAGRRTAEGMLFTDEYELTMAQLYFRMGLHETRAQFDHFFRSYPDDPTWRGWIPECGAWSTRTSTMCR